MGGVARGTLVLAALALLFGASACGERSEPTGATAPLYPVTVTGASDLPLRVSRPARRIVVLDPTLLALLDSLGVRARVVGMPTEPSGTIVLGRLARLRPDLIVAPSSTGELELSRAAAATHAHVYVAPGDSIREVEQAITDLGLLTGAPVRARRLVRRIERARRLVDRRLDGAPPVRVFFDTGLFAPAPDQSLVGDLVREARGRNVAGDVSQPVDPAELLRLDPRVYLTSSDSGTTLGDLRRNRQTRKLRAVRANRFAVIDAAVLEPGPRIGEGLVAIARALHPDAFR